MSRVDYFHDPDAPEANSIKVAVSAFVRNHEGRILMIRRTDNDKYSIPGGGLEAGETVTTAVVREVREVREETGVDVEVSGLVGIFSNPDHVIVYDDGEVRQEFSICFSADPVGGTLRTSSESKEVLWIAPQDIPTLDIHPSIALRIERGLQQTDGPFFT
ncbi:NUDIX hydrolase [Nocardia sp. GCM10030253]|uniref:NUDIX hydrolase n=1 Tax=Nocardia sp. GCM10030253 TaxID=3273404 RepID=UPI00363F6340